MTITEKSIYTTQLLGLLRAVKDNEVITYETMSSAIGLDVRPNKPGYGYQKSARDILERDDKIAFEVIPNVGIKRLTPEQVATGTGAAFQERKKSLLRRSKRRIETVNDHYDDLTPDAKTAVTMHRTVLAFESELSKQRTIRKIAAASAEVASTGGLIGFNSTLKLFEK